MLKIVILQPNEMYQWTHIELCRQQQNGPKKDCVPNKLRDGLETFEYENDSTQKLTSNGHEESFSSVKAKLLSNELATENESTNTQQTNIDSIQIDSESKNKFQEEFVQDVRTEIDHLKNVDCDNSIRRVYVESATQTDDLTQSTSKEEKSSEDKPPSSSAALLSAIPSPSVPPPPPPPPPPPSPFILTGCASMNNTKSIDQDVPTTASQPSNQSIGHSTSNTTILSSASSFCPPPPPPMNGIHGPPPLPLPTGNMWFKSDSKFFTVSIERYSILLNLTHFHSNSSAKSRQAPTKAND